MIRKHFLIDVFSGIVMAVFSYNLFVESQLTNKLIKLYKKIKFFPYSKNKVLHE